MKDRKSGKSGPSAGGKPSKDAPSASRRRFVLGGGAMAPVIVTLASRPALANVCTVSGTLSGNMSRPDAADCRGLTPAFWQSNPGQWPKYVVGPCNPITNVGGVCADYSVPTVEDLAGAVIAGALTQAEVDAYLLAPKGTPFSSVFGPGIAADPDLTLMQALWLVETPVLGHAVAAILNSVHFGPAMFGYTEAELVHMVATMVLGGNAAQLLIDLELLTGRG